MYTKAAWPISRIESYNYNNIQIYIALIARSMTDKFMNK